MKQVAYLLMVVGIVAAYAPAAAGQDASTETRRRAAERSAARSRLVAQADAAWDREMARETAADCRAADTTFDQNACLVEAIATTESNLRVYSGAFRAIFALILSGNSGLSGPTGSEPTADEFVKAFDDLETKWSLYRTAICSAAGDFYRPGTMAPIASSLCDLRVMRNHMRELGGSLGDSFHR